MYGIVTIEIYNYNKESYTYQVAYLSLLYHLSGVKTRVPKDEHCVLQCTLVHATPNL